MTASRIKKSFLCELDLLMANLSFRRVSDRFYGESYNRYDRRKAEIRDSLSPGFAPRQGYLQVHSPFISVRFDAVEKLVAKMEDPHPLITPDALEIRSTVGKTLGANLGSSTFKTWDLYTEEQAVKRAGKIFAQVNEEALSFWEQFSQPTEALALLLDDDNRARSAAGPDEVRTRKAIAFAFLAGGPEQANHMARELTARFKAQLSIGVWLERLLGD